MSNLEIKCKLQLSPECAKIKKIEEKDKWYGFSCLKCREFKKHNKLYYKSNKENIKIMGSIQYIENKEHILKRAKNYYQKNKEQIKEKLKINSKKYYQKNREKILEKQKLKRKNSNIKNISEL